MLGRSVFENRMTMQESLNRYLVPQKDSIKQLSKCEKGQISIYSNEALTKQSEI